MANGSGINIKVTGLNTEADRQQFASKCAEFWMNIISDKVSELQMTHERKVEFAEGVVDRIHNHGMEV